jgi:hypothetical protein
VPAKVAATELDPDATRARPRIERRGLQMVLRLLAYNGEAWLARPGTGGGAPSTPHNWPWPWAGRSTTPTPTARS